MNLGKTLVDLSKRQADLEPKPGETQSEGKSSQGSTDKTRFIQPEMFDPRLLLRFLIFSALESDFWV